MQLHVERADLAALLDIELAAALPACAGGVTWSSPLARDRFDEPRDARFWTAISRPDLGAAFADWWPQSGGPSWDAVGRIDSGAVVLVEAKAHVAEFGGKGMGATNPDSIEKIESALDGCRRALHASGSLADWLGPHYQLANRLAWTMRLRECGQEAVFVYLCFSDDQTNIPTGRDALELAVTSSYGALGIAPAAVDGWTTAVTLPAVG